MRYFVEIRYLGTHYCGWQRQPNGLSVQQCVEEALSTVWRTDISIVGAGRTDAGVHADQMFAHFDASQPLDTKTVVRSLNSLLPQDIAVYSVRSVKDDAHARFDALKRRYRYTITRRKDPMLTLTATRCEYQLDIESMNAAAALLMQYTDMTSFSKLHTDVKTNDCVVTEAHWHYEGEHLLVFHIVANRFLRNMVRAIVGTLLDVGRGRLSVDDFRAVIESRNRSRASTSAPAEGLSLIEIEYPPEIWQ